MAAADARTPPVPYPKDGKVLENLAEQHPEAGATYGALSAYAHGSVAMFQGQFQVTDAGNLGSRLNIGAMVPHVQVVAAVLRDAIQQAEATSARLVAEAHQ